MIAVAGASLACVALFAIDVGSLPVTVFAWALLGLSILWSIGPVHGIIYGPRLSLVGLWRLLCAPFRRR